MHFLTLLSCTHVVYRVRQTCCRRRHCRTTEDDRRWCSVTSSSCMDRTTIPQPRHHLTYCLPTRISTGKMSVRARRQPKPVRIFLTIIFLLWKFHRAKCFSRIFEIGLERKEHLDLETTQRSGVFNAVELDLLKISLEKWRKIKECNPAQCNRIRRTSCVINDTRMEIHTLSPRLVRCRGI